ncbi:hypothetical protein Tco_1337716 [Tanacetum coccineum]
METQKPLLKNEDGEELDVHMYRSMIGSLMYLTSLRPYIMFIVYACARYQSPIYRCLLSGMILCVCSCDCKPKLGQFELEDVINSLDVD